MSRNSCIFVLFQRCRFRRGFLTIGVFFRLTDFARLALTVAAISAIVAGTCDAQPGSLRSFSVVHTPQSRFLLQPMRDSSQPQYAASIGKLVGAGVAGAVLGIVAGSALGYTVGEGLLHCRGHGCGTDWGVGGAVVGEIIGVAFTIHRANSSQGDFRRTLMTSLASLILTPIFQIPAVVYMERATTP